MASGTDVVNEDSQNSIIEIEAPKKPTPLVIDLADEEIIINVKADIPDTPFSPGVPWVSQYDYETGLLGGSIKEEDYDLYKISDEENKENIYFEQENENTIEGENDDGVEEGNEEENEEGNDEENEDENGENRENDEANEDENGKNDELTEDESGKNDEATEDENGENEKNDEATEDENEDNEKNDEVTEDENEDEENEENGENGKNDEVNEDENEENGKNDEETEDKNGKNNEVTEDESGQNGKNDEGMEDENQEDEENDEVSQDQNGKTDLVIMGSNNLIKKEPTNDKNHDDDENNDRKKEQKKDVKRTQARNNQAIKNEISDVIDENGKTDVVLMGSNIFIKKESKDDDEKNDKNREQGKVGKRTEARNNRKYENEENNQGEQRNDQTRQGDEGRQNDHGRGYNQSQPGPSNSHPLATFSQGTFSLSSFSEDRIPQDLYSQPSFYRPSWYRSPYPLMPPTMPRDDDSETHHPVHWTPEMVRFYDEDWGNEKEFIVEKLQEGMNKDPSLWQISSRDVAYWRNKDKKPVIRCYNCFDCGHESYNCPQEEREPKCHMCGTLGHIAYKCPNSLCLNCGTATTGYVTKCSNCKFGLDKVCERCNLTGHIYSECTDHWRLYHSTIGTKRVDVPRHDIYKPIRNRWCCNCGRQGHLQVECDFCVKNADYSDTLPFVSSYVKAFTRGSQLAYGYEEPDGPKRLKISVEDNIMTNPSQKHVFQRKTSQLKNKLRFLAKDAMRRDRARNIDRRRHAGGGFNRFSIF